MLICICPDPLECPAIGSDVSCFPWCDYLEEVYNTKEYDRQRMEGYAERDRQWAKAQALSPFSNPRFNRYARHNKEREV